jgi:hypothetical protein
MHTILAANNRSTAATALLRSQHMAGLIGLGAWVMNKLKRRQSRTPLWLQATVQLLAWSQAIDQGVGIDSGHPARPLKTCCVQCEPEKLGKRQLRLDSGSGDRRREDYQGGSS